MVRGGPRSQIAIPAQGMIEFRDALTDLLDEFGTDDGGFKGELPEGRHMRVENKNFYFDIGQNNRGIYMRISEVSISPDAAWAFPCDVWPHVAQRTWHLERIFEASLSFSVVVCGYWCCRLSRISGRPSRSPKSRGPVSVTSSPITATRWRTATRREGLVVTRTPSGTGPQTGTGPRRAVRAARRETAARAPAPALSEARVP